MEVGAGKPRSIKIPKPNTQEWRNWKAEADAAGLLVVELRQKKLDKLAEQQDAAREWLKARGLDEQGVRDAYSRPRLKPGTAREKLERGVRGFR